MEKNIFEGAKFGDKFLTKDGRIAIFHHYKHNFVYYFTEDSTLLLYTKDDCGELVSRYKELIDEEREDKLAEKYSKCIVYDPDTDEEIEGYDSIMLKGFKAGYRKAKEEYL